MNTDQINLPNLASRRQAALLEALDRQIRSYERYLALMSKQNQAISRQNGGKLAEYVAVERGIINQIISEQKIISALKAEHQQETQQPADNSLERLTAQSHELKLTALAQNLLNRRQLTAAMATIKAEWETVKSKLPPRSVYNSQLPPGFVDITT